MSVLVYLGASEAHDHNATVLKLAVDTAVPCGLFLGPLVVVVSVAEYGNF